MNSDYTRHWTFDANINWIRELSLLIKNNISDLPEIISKTIGLNTTFLFLFFKCEINKVLLLNLKPVKSVKEMIEQINIIKSLKYPHFCNEYILDKSLADRFIRKELDELKLKCENKSYRLKVQTLVKDNEEAWGENKSLNNLLSVAHSKIKNGRTHSKINRGKKELTFDLAIKLYPDLKKIVSSQAEKCRFKNGNLNCSKLGNKFNIDHKTAKSWCEKLGIPLSLSYLQ